MGLHKTEANLKVAMRENEVILKEMNYQEHYGNFDPRSPEAYIIFSLYQHAFLEQSIELAGLIEKYFSQSGRYSRGVKQAGFLVLYMTAMPSVLVETGFLTNPDEEKFLSSSEGQQIIARAIYRAVRDYILRLDSLNRQQELHAAVDTVVTPGYYVQVMAIKNDDKVENVKLPELPYPVKMWRTDEWIRILAGPFDSKQEAKKALSVIRKEGFEDAFIRQID